MRVVIIATGETPGLEKLTDRMPTPMLPLIDRPIIQHLVEMLVEHGFSTFDFILSHLPDRIEEFLGDGTRWGCSFTFHLVRDPLRPYAHCATLFANPEEPVMLMHADRLVMDMSPAMLNATPTTLVLYASPDSTEPVWSGIAIFIPATLRSLPPETDEHALERFLTDLPGCATQLTDGLLDIRTFPGLLAAQRWLHTHPSHTLLTGTEADPGVRLSRNVYIHPRAKIQPPVFIGENCIIGPRVQLGPDVVVGANTILEAECVVSDSLILPWSYIGEALDVEHSIIDRNRLINVHHNVSIDITDDFILGTLARNAAGHALRRLGGRLAAAVLALISLPAVIATVLFLKLRHRSPVVLKRECVRLPTPKDEARWQTVILHSFATTSPSRACGWSHVFTVLLPGVWDILRGRARFVGVYPRTPAELRALPADWQTLYRSAEPGLITEAMIMYGPEPSPDELYAAEALFAVQDSFRNDLRIIAAYIGSLF